MKTTPESSLPRRKLSGRFWHQGPTRHPLGSFADPALTVGRYHRPGAAGARAEGYEGLLAPSAAVHGGKTLVVFAVGMHRLVLEESRVRQPPPRLADLLRAIRLRGVRGDVPGAVRSYLEGLANAGAEKVRAVPRGRRAQH